MHRCEIRDALKDVQGAVNSFKAGASFGFAPGAGQGVFLWRGHLSCPVKQSRTQQGQECRVAGVEGLCAQRLQSEGQLAGGAGGRVTSGVCEMGALFSSYTEGN